MLPLLKHELIAVCEVVPDGIDPVEGLYLSPRFWNNLLQYPSLESKAEVLVVKNLEQEVLVGPSEVVLAYDCAD